MLGLARDLVSLMLMPMRAERHGDTEWKESENCMHALKLLKLVYGVTSSGYQA